MARIEWSAELEIGIAVIDGQHRRIVGYINDLADMGATPGRSTVAQVTADLLDYTDSHFAFEDALMEEAGYDHLAIHQQTHNAFRTRVDTLRERFVNGDDAAQPLAELLKTCLISHIVSDDTSYAPLVKQKMARIERQRQGAWLSDTLRRFFA